MKHDPISRGGAPVGHLGELGTIQASAVIYWRLWAEGAEGQRRVQSDFRSALGEEAGFEAVQAFAQIFDMCTRHFRRPLMRHGLGCKCIGADESCFANLIGYASECKHEDAALLASLMINPDLCMPLAALAQTFGLALRRMTRAPVLTDADFNTYDNNKASKTIH